MKPVFVVMGVSGSGKSTIAGALNAHLGWPFLEGDTLHPPANVAKMRAGVPLTDADRAPWLLRVREWIDARGRAGEPGLVTCSALKRAYRDYLSDGRPEVRFLYLQVPRATLRARLAKRSGHFMPASLLGDQLQTMEPPQPDEHALVIDAGGEVDGVVETILSALAVPG